MDSHVPIEITALTKSKQTQLTLVRFLTGVNSQVLGKRRAVGERLLAKSTPGSRPREINHRHTQRKRAGVIKPACEEIIYREVLRKINIERENWIGVKVHS